MTRRRRKPQKIKRAGETQAEAYWCGICYEEHKHEERRGVECRKCGRVSHCEETYGKWQRCCVCRASWCGSRFSKGFDFGEGLPAELERRVQQRLGVGGGGREWDILYENIVALIIVWLTVVGTGLIIMRLQGTGSFVGLTCPEQKRVCTEENPCSDMGIMAMKFPEPAAVIACEEYWTGSTTTGMWVLQDEQENHKIKQKDVCKV